MGDGRARPRWKALSLGKLFPPGWAACRFTMGDEEGATKCLRMDGRCWSGGFPNRLRRTSHSALRRAPCCFRRRCRGTGQPAIYSGGRTRLSDYYVLFCLPSCSTCGLAIHASGGRGRRPVSHVRAAAHESGRRFLGYAARLFLLSLTVDGCPVRISSEQIMARTLAHLASALRARHFDQPVGRQSRS